MKSTKNILRSAAILALFLPLACAASVQITEVMYDLEGSDGGYEWIEITNTGSQSVDVGTWRLFEGSTNHKLTASKGQSTVLLPGTSAIIADKPDNFLSHWPAVVLVFDSAFSLSNTGETLVLKNGSTIVDQVAYSEEMGAKGDGGSLHREGDSFVAAQPNPGVYPGERRAIPVKVAETTAKLATPSSAKKVASQPKKSEAALQVATPAAAEEHQSFLPWVVGLLSIIGLGITAVVLAKNSLPAQETSDPADEFEIIDAGGKKL